MNFHDSEKISGILTKKGYELAQSLDNADVIIINTCSVREKPEHKLYTELGRIAKRKTRNPNLIVIVAGCVAQQEGNNLIKKNHSVDIVIGPKNICELPNLIEMHEICRDTKFVNLSSAKQTPAFNIENINRVSNYKAYVTIMEGCNKFCSYCIVPFTRGREIYRDYNDILNEVKLLAEDGCKEICLLGQNVNSYHYNNYTFADVLENVSKTKGIERIRFVTSYPKEFDIRIIELMKNNSIICPSLHLPVQSGSDEILERMRRGYAAGEYLELIDKIKNILPEIALSTDIIVGFPGETDEDFQKTVSLISRAEFIIMYSFKYSPRPFTYALRYKDDVAPEIKQQRLDIVQSIQKEIQEKKFSSFIGSIKKVLVEGYSKKGQLELTGRTVENVVVNFRGSDKNIGKIVSVKINEAYSNSLKGEIQ